MKTFMFYQKNSSAVLTLSDETFEGAEQQLADIVKDTYGWRCDNPDGEDDDDGE